MRRVNVISVCGMILVLAMCAMVQAGLVYQDFEPSNGSSPYGWGLGDTQAGLTSGNDPVHGGSRAWKITSVSQWGRSGIPSQVQTWNFNFEPQRHDQLSFWIYALPSIVSDNNVGVKFFDNGIYKTAGFEVWTNRKARCGEWTRLHVLFSQLPPDFNLSSVDKIEIANYLPGTYVIDDIQVILTDRTYQTFELGLEEDRPDMTPQQRVDLYGWPWLGDVAFFLDENIVQEGAQAWRLETNQLMGGTGMRCEEKKYVNGEQSNWNVDLNPSQNDRLTFWVYALPETGMDNNLAVQFFDNDSYFANPYVLWTKKQATYGQWTKFMVPFSDLRSLTGPAVNLSNINKVQLQMYWRGAYIIDDIRAAKPSLGFSATALRDGTAQWNAVSGAGLYTVQESAGPNGPWQTVFEGTGTSFSLKRVSPIWLRGRWQEAVVAGSNPVPYVSDWSESIQYQPFLAVLRNDQLQLGKLAWSGIPRATSYELQQSSYRYGPWTAMYSGSQTSILTKPTRGKWYRVRGVFSDAGMVKDTTVWSPCLRYQNSGKGYIKAVNRDLREEDGSGAAIQLRGINLGNHLLIEPWMTGMSIGIAGKNDDDWTIRETLTQRFGATEAARLLTVYRNAYTLRGDYDQLCRIGVNLVRVPIYYRAIRELDEVKGTWKTGTSFNFTAIDDVINYCADRGMYVLLDLHGAPGGQSKEAHCGRMNFNKLFDPANDAFRQRTVELWTALANRYKSNPAVLGYDLVNEPYGVLSYYQDKNAGYQALWNLYNRLYKAVRNPTTQGGAGDTSHLIVMESIPSDLDWETLPKPTVYGWTNVLYQFHYYGFKFKQDSQTGEFKLDGTLPLDLQRKYLVDGNDPDGDARPDDEKFKGKVLYSKQQEYNVPVLIGELSGFDERAIWDLFLQTFEQQRWSWTAWSYKFMQPSNWGIVGQITPDADRPVIGIDSKEVLEAKFNKYATVPYHARNETLTTVLANYYAFSQASAATEIAGRMSDYVFSSWRPVSFTRPLKTEATPAIVAGMESFNDADPSDLRMKSASLGGFETKRSEERSGGQPAQYAGETVGFFGMAPGIVRNTSGVAIGEAGVLTAYQHDGGVWHTVTLKNSFTRPVVLMNILTMNGRQPCHIRLRNVQNSSFEFQIEEWEYLDQRHLTETVSYVVLEQGAHQLASGLRVEAGAVPAYEGWRTVGLVSGFTVAPATISQPQTVNNSQAVITRQQAVTAASFAVCLQQEAGGTNTLYSETVGYIAAEIK